MEQRADIFLVKHGFYESRARAQTAIKAGCVKVNGRVLKKPSEKISQSATIEAKAEHPWVSRGGIKLAYALDYFKIDPASRICLDIGSSTGGFSEVLLSRGAHHVFAVDVGHDQLHPSLHNQPRLTSLEGQDARTLTDDIISPPPDLIVTDASFISLKKVLEIPLSLCAQNAQLIALVKPQFEVGKTGLGRGGVVKSESLCLQVLSDVCAWVAGQNWSVIATTPSPIKGGSGNREYLLYAAQNFVQ